LEISELAEKLLQDYALCDRCLGRQFALLVSGTDNSERGRALKLVLASKAHRMIQEGNREGEQLLEKLATNGFFKPAYETLKKQGIIIEEEQKECYLCRGKAEKIEPLTDEILQELGNLHFRTFLVGIKIPPSVVNEEDEVKSKLGIIWGEEIRNEFSREIGKAISKKTGKEVDHKNPEVSIFVDPLQGEFEVKMNPIYLIGRYRKLVGGIPQTAWKCKTCNGQGCPECKGRGGTSGNSVEENISRPILEMTSGEEIRFKPIGREDNDSRVLGNGRPFVIELRGAKQVPLILTPLQELINKSGSGKIEVTRLARTTREVARKITTRVQTTVLYRVILKLKAEITVEKLETLERVFSKVMVSQYMPSGKSRPRQRQQKYIYETLIRRLASDQIELTIKCQGGTRIRDLISEVEFKTEPNLTDILEAETSETQVDVMDVQVEGLDDEIQGI
jgi:tRNA pseudouridine synthase 10